MSQTLQPGRYNGTIFLADISGYTSFLDDVQKAHAKDAFADGQIPQAYALMSSLLDGIATLIDPPMTFVKFEGDAVFAVAPTDAMPHGEAMLECVTSCYRGFTERLDETGLVWTCVCDACSRRSALDLKFVVHSGDYFVQAIGERVEVLGPDVTMAHRLLKNSAAERIGSTAYALFTDAAVGALELDLVDPTPVDEHIDGTQTISTQVVSIRA